MGLFNIDPARIGMQIATTAAGKAAQAVSQSLSPKLVQDVQRVLKVGNVLGNTLGLRTGIGVIDNLFSLTGGDAPSTLLGGLTFKQARSIHDQLKAARVAKKNLFFLRVTDGNPPKGDYQPAAPASSSAGSLGGLISSRIGAAVGTVSAGISGAVGSIAGKSAGNFTSQLLDSALGGSTTSIAGIALNTFDLLAMDVSYGDSVSGDHVAIGSTFFDKPTGSTPNEVSVTTMDDEAGTLKRWFMGKLDQVALPDGTFGLPWEYLVTIEIVHAIPSDQVENYQLAYSKTFRLRPQAVQVEMSRREQAVAELQMVFVQYDGFAGVR